MEKNIDKNKYEAQDKYQKKTYQRVLIKLRKEWNLYDTIQIISQKNQCSVNALVIYYLVEGLKKEGFKPSPELLAFIDNNYKK